MKTIFTLFTVLSVFTGYSQNGPGGVGDRTGASTLDMWFDANDLDGDGLIEGLSESVLSGTAVLNWNDKSGNGIVAGATPTRPVFAPNTHNGYPRINFALNTWNCFNAGLIPRSNNETIFCVSTVLDNGNRSMYDAGLGNQRRLNTHAALGFNYYLISGFGGTVSNNSVPYTSLMISRAVFGTGAGNSSLQLNQNTPVPTGNASNIINNSAMAIGNAGGLQTGLTNLYGNISEIIIYSGTVNSAQSIIIHNYLSAKYNIPLLSGDLYVQDNAGNGNFDHDVAGIGRVDAANIHSDAQGTGIVRILNPSNLDDNEFLIWGHDVGIEQATVSTENPPGVQARFERLWRVNEVNAAGTAVDVGSVNVRFNLSAFSMVTASDLRLIVDTDNDGVFSDETAIGGATALAGNVYQFAGVTALSNGTRFTLGTANILTSPLPVELTNFEVRTVENRNVRADWRTETELNNDYFTLEKSENGSNWEIVQEISGAGTSSSPLFYTLVDNEPFRGISYYRLKQTDLNGQYTYSDIRSVLLDFETPGIYPNPASDIISVVSDESDLRNFRLYDELGRDVTTSVILLNESSKNLLIDISKLTNGSYMLKIGDVSMRLQKI
jgi:hypothetical protein